MVFRNDLTAEFLRSILRYVPETGEWFWVETKHKKHVNEPICSSTKTCPQIRINGRNYLSSRLAFLYMTGRWPEQLIDHIDVNPLNNRWANLREADKRANAMNTRPPKNNTSGHKGVSWSKNKRKWEAYIKVDQKRLNLGRYKDKEDAIRAYRNAATKHFGEFARFS